MSYFLIFKFTFHTYTYDSRVILKGVAGASKNTSKDPRFTRITYMGDTADVTGGKHSVVHLRCVLTFLLHHILVLSHRPRRRIVQLVFSRNGFHL
jgi:hypothetical protein